MAVVAAVTFLAPSISFLWHNVIGAATVVLVGIVLSAGGRGRQEADDSLDIDWRHHHAE
jgi:hypothetical protein